MTTAIKNINPATHKECPFCLKNIKPEWCALLDDPCIHIEEKQDETGESVVAFAGYRCQKESVGEITINFETFPKPYDINAPDPPIPSYCGALSIGVWCVGCEREYKDKCELFKEAQK